MATFQNDFGKEFGHKAIGELVTEERDPEFFSVVSNELRSALKDEPGLDGELGDEQFFFWALPRLLEVLFLKFIEMVERMRCADRADTEDWLRKTLDFEACIVFNLSGRRILEKLNMEKLRCLEKKPSNE